jgi:hypothetical protein
MVRTLAATYPGRGMVMTNHVKPTKALSKAISSLKGISRRWGTPPSQYLIQEHNTSYDSPRTHEDHAQPLAAEGNVPHVSRYECV